MAQEYAEVTITLTKESYDTLIRLCHQLMAELPEDSPEHGVISHIRGAAEAQIGHGGKAFM
jgi:hypothetical protein